MATKIDSKTARENLPARREPHWQKLRTGLHLGYRKPEAGEGTWIARHTEGAKKTYQALGQFFDKDNDKSKRNAFAEAKAAAERWAGNTDAGVEVHGTTIEAACEAYVLRQRSEKGAAAADDAAGRFRRLVYGTSFGRVRLDRLTTVRVRAWRDSQLPKEADEEGMRRAKDSANRNLATLKAALNMATADRLVATDAGWKTVTKFAAVSARRALFLSAQQRTSLLGACSGGLQELVRGLLLTALRPGELAAAVAGDFDRKHGTLNIRKSKTLARIVPLSSAAVAYFSDLTRERIGAHPLVADDFGGRWDKDKWKKPFKAACVSAGLPTDAVMYSLRHAAISELLIGGMDAHTVAKIAGTSIDMIDKHYGHLCIERTRKQLDAVNLC
jgi:integrase